MPTADGSSPEDALRPALRLVVVTAALAGALTLPSAANAQSMQDLNSLSLEELANVQVSSVTKQAESLSSAPAAIFVITHNDIIRSGASSIPEMLRLAPNLQVVQTSASNYIVTARGFNGSSAAQSYSDKLLVLIDGRSVYSPLYSGVYWDVQDVLPDDVDRIEVISGPGATLWGANAVNGVINIITLKSADTQGGVAQVEAGNLGEAASLRYGGRVNDDLTWRVYAKGFIRNDTETANGASDQDGWSKPQGGFRVDWSRSEDSVALQGDLYSGSESQPGAPDQAIAGGNLLARWNHQARNGSTLQVQAYYDETRRSMSGGGSGFVLHTYDLDIQHSFSLGSRHNIVWGGGYRLSQYDITNTANLLFIPSSATLNLGNAFAQDSILLTRALTLILGIKLEDDPYSGLAPLPSARISWKVSDRAMLWAAVSRAIRSPTPFDRDVVEYLGSLKFLIGGPDFQPEKLTAYEVGARVQASSRLSFSVSAFYNVYNDLRSIELEPNGFVLPLRWGNMMQGDTYGVEAWANLRATDWWQLTAAFNVQHESLRFKPGASGLLGVAQAGDDPHHQASLRSSMNLGSNITLDADLRHVGPLPDPAVPAYVELDARLGWRPTTLWELSVSGSNLLHARHVEFSAPANDVERSFVVAVRRRF